MNNSKLIFLVNRIKLFESQGWIAMINIFIVTTRSNSSKLTWTLAPVPAKQIASFQTLFQLLQTILELHLYLFSPVKPYLVCTVHHFFQFFSVLYWINVFTIEAQLDPKHPLDILYVLVLCYFPCYYTSVIVYKAHRCMFQLRFSLHFFVSLVFSS